MTSTDKVHEVIHWARQTAKLFRAEPEPVYVLEDGRFLVRRDGDWKPFGSFAGVEKSRPANLGRKPVKVMRLEGSGHVTVKEIIAWDHRKIIFANGTQQANRYGSGGWMLYDEKTIKAYAAFCKQLAALQKRVDDYEQAWEDKLPDRLTRDMFRQIQEGQQ